MGLAVVASAELDESAARALKHTIAARFRRESEPMARPSTIVIVTDIPRNAVRQGRPGLACSGGNSEQGQVVVRLSQCGPNPRRRLRRVVYRPRRISLMATKRISAASGWTLFGLFC